MIEINQIYNVDCIEGMKCIPDGSIDAIICDLPYGTTANRWDTVIPLEELWGGYKRVIKKNGVIVLFAQIPFASVLACSNLEWLKYEWIWIKENSTGFLNSHHAPLKLHENILIFTQGCCSSTRRGTNNTTYNPQMGVGKPYYIKEHNAQSFNYGKFASIDAYSDGGRYPNDVLYFPRDPDKIHPTQKPVDLIRYLVRTYTNEGETVLDNCMGSGTTAIACIKEKRNFIGFETDDEFYKSACKRIEAELVVSHSGN